MKMLRVSYNESIDKKSSLSHISSKLDNLKKNLIDKVPWPAFPYKPDVSFVVSYSDGLFIKYFVAEKSIRALYSQTNDPVYKDSCVELFMSFNGEAEYYNLEFNCMGTCLGGYGAGKSGRTLLPQKLINAIRYRASINSSNDLGRTKISWELTLVIPFEVFAYHDMDCLKGLLCKANFFKCGDETSEPHFLAWNNITAASPDFHLPQFFGEVHFI